MSSESNPTDSVAMADASLPVDARVAWVAALCLTAVVASARQIITKSPEHGFFVDSLAWVVLGTAAMLDIAYRRIPNTLTYPAILLGLALNVVVPAIIMLTGPNVFSRWLGGTTPRDGLIGFSACAAFGLISFILRGVGGGDAKALGAFGALLGFDKALPALFNCLLIGAVISVINMLCRGELIRKLQSLFGAVFVAAILKRRPEHVHIFTNREAPFVMSLFLGFALSSTFQMHRFVFAFLG